MISDSGILVNQLPGLTPYCTNNMVVKVSNAVLIIGLQIGGGPKSIRVCIIPTGMFYIVKRATHWNSDPEPGGL